MQETNQWYPRGTKVRATQHIGEGDFYVEEHADPTKIAIPRGTVGTVTAFNPHHPVPPNA